MGLSSEEIALIEKIVDGSASVEEQELFREKCAESEDFKREADFQLNLTQTLKAKVRAEEKRALLASYQSFKANNPTESSTKTNFRIIGLAASILFLAAFSILFFSQSSDSLFDKYYTPYTGANITRGTNEPDGLHGPMQYYRQENYEKALELFLEFAEKEPTTTDVNILIGICYLESNELEKSKSYFQKTFDTDKEFVGIWYITMILLKEENYQEAQQNLESIVNSSSPYQKKSIQLLKEIEHSP